MARQINHTDSREHIGEHKSVHVGNIARDGGKPKGSAAGIAVHSGMTDQQKAMAGVGGLSHATIAGVLGANPANPIMSKAPMAKVLAPVATSFGMKNRTRPGMSDQEAQDLGKLILAGAKR
jgi:hypothetical protein